MLDDNIPESVEIRDCLSTLAQEEASLRNLWEERRILYEQCMDLQLFYRFRNLVTIELNLTPFNLLGTLNKPKAGWQNKRHFY